MKTAVTSVKPPNFWERAVALYWPELVLFALLAAGSWKLYELAGLDSVFAVLGWLALTLLIVSRSRRFRSAVARFIRRQRWQGRIQAALLEHAEFWHRFPHVTAVQARASSVTVSLRLRPHTNVDQLQHLDSHFATFFSAASATITPNPGNAALVVIDLVFGQPLAESELPLPDSLLSGSTSLFALIPLGLTAVGLALATCLIEKNLLIAGEPGSGKSKFLRLLLAWILRDPMVQLVVMNGKLGELDDLEPLCSEYCGPDIDEALRIATWIRDEVLPTRYAKLAAQGLKKITPTCGFGPLILVVEEGPYFAMSGKEGKAWQELIRDIAARGRACGIILILVAQRPSSDVINTSLRDLISHRVCFRISTRDASDIALGAGWASEGFDASTIAPAHRGVGYFLGDEGRPQLFRSYLISDVQESQVVKTALDLRKGGAEND